MYTECIKPREKGETTMTDVSRASQQQETRGGQRKIGGIRSKETRKGLFQL
jgi:hypothetical protein